MRSGDIAAWLAGIDWTVSHGKGRWDWVADGRSGTPPADTLSDAKETTYQNIIGALLTLIEGDGKQFPKRASLVRALSDAGTNKRGLSESTLNRKLPECMRVFNSV